MEFQNHAPTKSTVYLKVIYYYDNVQTHWFWFTYTEIGRKYSVISDTNSIRVPTSYHNITVSFIRGIVCYLFSSADSQLLSELSYSESDEQLSSLDGVHSVSPFEGIWIPSGSVMSN